MLQMRKAPSSTFFSWHKEIPLLVFCATQNRNAGYWQGVVLKYCAIPIASAPAPVPAGLANPAPARPCVGRWPFASVLASGQSLQTTTVIIVGDEVTSL